MAQAEGVTLEHALEQDPNGLTTYRGKPITAVTIAIRGAGDGLSKAMQVAPQIFEMGDVVRILLEGEVKKHVIEMIEKADSYELKLDIKADTAMIVEDKASASKLRVMKDRIQKHEETKKGKGRLDGMDAEDLEPKDDDDASEPGTRPDPDWEDDDPQE